MKHFLVGTAGHVDHGKTSLIGALTQVDTDRLPEEKERGLSIDLGFAPLTLSGADEIAIGIVDVPGHQKFLRNMIAGVGGFDAALLVVDAGEGVKPQTREHLEILTLLETPRGLAVVTKADRYDDDSLELARLELGELLHGTFLEGEDILTVSIHDPESLEQLKSRLYQVLQNAEPRKATGPARLPLDRAFSQTGFGNVVTGSLWSGTLHTGDEIELMPAKKRARIRGLQVHGEVVDSAVAGQRVAVNLAGVELSELGRGLTVVSPPKQFPVATRFGVSLQFLKLDPDRLTRKSRATFFQATSHAQVKVQLVFEENSSELFGQLEFDHDVFLCPGDRFLLRDETDQEILAGGRVLAIDERSFQRRQAKSWLRRYQTLAGGGSLSSLLQALEQSGGFSKLTPLLKSVGWSVHDWETQQVVFQESGRLRVFKDKVWGAETFETQSQLATSLLRRLQESAPWRPGWKREELTKILGLKTGRDDGFFDILEALVSQGELRRRGGQFSTADYQPALSEPLEKAAQQLEANLKSDGVAPRDWEVALSEVSPDSKSFAVLSEHLLGLGRVEKLTEKLAFLPSALADAREVLAQKAQEEPFTASEAKEWLDISRKFIIPVLEWMDLQGWTHRIGDERVMRKALNLASEEGREESSHEG